MIFHNLIKGSNFTDERGRLNFFNAFSMNEIVRMYEILPSDTTTIRGWQGHKKEKKWFYCNSGSFIMNLIQVDNFDAPSKSLLPQKFVLEAHNPAVLEISGGYASGFKAQEENSKLMVFSNLSLEASKRDDFRFPVDYWSGKW